MSAVAAEVSAKDELHRLIDEMDDEDAAHFLWFLGRENGNDELTPWEEERIAEARSEIRRGLGISLDDLKVELGL